MCEGRVAAEVAAQPLSTSVRDAVLGECELLERAVHLCGTHTKGSSWSVQ